MTGQTLVVLIVIARRPSAITIRNIEEKKFLTGPRRYSAHQWRHGEVEDRESVWAWNLQAHSLLVNLKPEWEFKVQEEEKNTQVVQTVSYQINLDL